MEEALQTLAKKLDKTVEEVTQEIEAAIRQIEKEARAEQA